VKCQRTLALVGFACALACAVGSRASAQDFGTGPSYLWERVDAPRRALELGATAGYAQSLGMTSGHTAGPGLGASLGVGYRVTPNLSLTWTGRYAVLPDDGRAISNGASIGLHVDPFARVDPVVSVGLGHRVAWGRDDVTRHGLELAKVRATMDVRATNELAVGPMIGVDLSLLSFGGTSGAMERTFGDVSAFVYAGAEVRWDLGGERVRGRRRRP
jgi:hypothetical protein